MLEAVLAPLVLFVGGVIFLGSGKFSVGCGKGATFPLEKQSACNYIRADCVQRKCVPRIRAQGDVAQIVYAYMCVCVCVCLRAICFIDKGRMWKKWKLPPLTHFTEAGRPRSCEIL